MLYIDKSFYNSTENYLALALIQTGSVWIFLPQRIVFVFVWFCICNCIYMYIYVIVFVFSNGVETGCVVVLFLCPSEFSGLSQLQGRRQVLAPTSFESNMCKYLLYFLFPMTKLYLKQTQSILNQPINRVFQLNRRHVVYVI